MMCIGRWRGGRRQGPRLQNYTGFLLAREILLLALARISILMRAAANISLRLFPVYELGFAGCNLLVPLSQNVLMPCWGLKRVRIAAQIVPESLHGLELLFEGHFAKG